MESLNFKYDFDSLYKYVICFYQFWKKALWSIYSKFRPMSSIICCDVIALWGPINTVNQLRHNMHL